MRIGHPVGVTSPRRAAILALVLVAVVTTVAVPLRNYLSQRSELAAVHAQQEMLNDEIAELERRRALLTDPRYVEAQARERLRYVRPGETPYMVQLPTPTPAPEVAEEPDEPWYTWLWESIAGD